MSQPQPSPRADATRSALIRAGLELFGAKGFDATSTREIAAGANANIAAIAYHFGGKEGLRGACADFVVATIRQIFASAAGEADATETLTPAGARDALARIGSDLIDAIVVRGEARPIVRFVMREMFEPSAAFETLYRAIGPMHARACAIWSRATGAPAESETTRLAVFAFIGQLIYFRIARPAVLRRMEWRDIGPAEGAAIKRLVLGNLDAALDLARKTHP